MHSATKFDCDPKESTNLRTSQNCKDYDQFGSKGVQRDFHPGDGRRIEKGNFLFLKFIRRPPVCIIKSLEKLGD